MALKERTITIHDYESVDPNDIRDALLTELQKNLDQINSLISNLARDDKSEIDRIERAHERIIYQSAIKMGYCDDVKHLSSRELSCLDDKEPTLAEGFASAALFFHDLCGMSLRDVNLSEVFASFAFANQFLGEAVGCDRTKAMNDKNKRLIQQCAAQVRHAENRSMKEEAIRYYKDNHASFTSKDDAALKIAEKIVPAKFATVRGWLKGINPE